MPMVMPKLDLQSRYDYETHYHLTLEAGRFGKALAHIEAFKMTQEIPGVIIEAGVCKGTSLCRFAMLREVLGNYSLAKIIGFDIFGEEYPDTEYEEDKGQRNHWIDTEAGVSISPEQLSEIFAHMGVENFELIKGDINVTVPKYAEEHKGLKICLLNIDCDFVEPTYTTLEHFYDLVMPGGVILLDNYAGEGSTADSFYGGHSYHGDTKGVDKFFQDRGIQPNILRFPWVCRPCYIIKE